MRWLYILCEMRLLPWLRVIGFTWIVASPFTILPELIVLNLKEEEKLFVWNVFISDQLILLSSYSFIESICSRLIIIVILVVNLDPQQQLFTISTSFYVISSCCYILMYISLLVWQLVDGIAASKWPRSSLQPTLHQFMSSSFLLYLCSLILLFI